MQNSGTKQYRYAVLGFVWAIVTFALSACGGGGGDSTPSGTFSISGTVQLPNSPVLAPLPDAQVQVYVLPEMTLLGITTRTDTQGRYTLTNIPATYAGRDLLIVAEKDRNGQRVRAMTLSLKTPLEGVSGADLDPFTTYATAEVVRYALENNLRQIAPNGFAEVVRQVREQLQNETNLTPIVGQTLPNDLTEGILQEQIRNRVRERVQEQAQNLQPSEGDVAIAKSMMQMLRDTNIGAVNLADTESIRLEEDIRRLEDGINREVITPIKGLGGRGLQYLFELLSEDNSNYPPLIGREPGRYEHYRNGNTIQIRRVGNTPDNRTWEIVNNVPNDRFQGLTVRISTQNALEGGLNITPDAGRYVAQVRSSGDSRLQYDVTLEVTQKDSQNRPTQLRATISLYDGQLSQSIQFNGTMGLTPRPGEDLSFSQVRFTGTFTSQYGSLNVTNLVANIDENQAQRRNQVSVQCDALQLTLRTSRNASVEIRGLNLQYVETWDGDILTPAELRAQSIQLKAGDAELILTNSRIRLVPNDRDNADYPANLSGQLDYRTPKVTLVGSLEFVWENAGTARLDWEEASDEIPLEGFPIGQITLTNGTIKPAVGQAIGLSFTLRFEPNASTPRVRFEMLRLSLGAETMQGTLTATMNVRNGRVNRHQSFSSTTMTMTYSPSNFQLTFTTQGATFAERTFAGEIKKPDGTRIAQIGKASELGLSELGNLLIVKYNDNTFESLQSLLPTR